MFTKRSFFRICILLIATLLISGTASASPLSAPLGTSFTYQGRLTDGGTPANGSYDFQFKLFDALSGGLQVGSDFPVEDVPVSSGLFTVQLDFGNVFDGRALYLEIAVRPAGGTSYTTLTPRQPLSPTPYAFYAQQAYGASRLEGQPGSYYLNAGNINAGTLENSFFDAYANLGNAGYLGNAAGDLSLNNGTLQPTLNADLLDNLEASAFSLASHNHWGETWTGSGTGLTLSGGTTGLSASGSARGVYGATVSGNAILGYASGADGFGVYGDAYGARSIGVYGSGISYGVYGTADDGPGVNGVSTNFIGVRGYGPTGVVAQSFSSGGEGLYAIASGGAGTNYAGYFLGNVQIDGSLGLTSNMLITNLNADLLDGYHADNAAGNVPINNGTRNTNLNSDMLDGQHDTYYMNVSNINAGTLGNSFFDAFANLLAAGYLDNGINHLAINNGTLNINLNADLLDGLHAGNATSNVPINNGTRNISLNADMLDGQHADNYSMGVPISNGITNFKLNADLLDGSHAASFAPATHNHWGETWTGTGTGLTLSSSNTSVALSLGGTGTGVYGSGQIVGIQGLGNTGVQGQSNVSGGRGIYGAASGGSGNYAGYFDGNVYINGTLTATSKSAIAKTKDYGTRTLYVVESPENWFEDFGTGQLVNGTALITIEPIYAETVNLTEDYHVFLTPRGDCTALYVEATTPSSFSVKASGGQTCSIAFDYRIIAKRLGYEDNRLAEVNDTQPAAEPPGK